MSFTPSKDYQDKYQLSISDAEKFWKIEASRLKWIKAPSKIKNTSFANEISIKWFEDGQLNACYNCVDRYVEEGKGDETAIIWEGDDPSKSSKISYNELQKEVSIFANILEKNGVKKGDRVTIYMPMILEAAFAMLACARIGAVHCVVFGGFSSSALAGRIEDCEPKLIITADESLRGGKKIALKQSVDEALESLKSSIKTLVIKNTGSEIKWNKGRDIWYHEERKNVSDTHKNIAVMNAEDPFFILYTSGSTGKPKGILHTTAGYLLYSAITFAYAFDFKKGDVFWCSADIGWITGHSYTIYGPLLNGGTTLMFEGIPNYPDPSRFWQVIDKHKVNSFYTAPTAIRALMREGDKYVKSTSRKSLRILGSVGEPINPAAWQWYNDVVGEKRCKVVDTWWQTETGGHMILPLPGHIEPKPGFATLPFFGIKPILIDNDGKKIKGEGEGNLCIADSWPGQARSVYKNHQRFKETYFEKFPGLYFSGDGAKRDEDGYFRITGRTDDVIKVSGHRIGTAEVEAALNKDSKVSESAVIGVPHEIKGEAIYAFVILKQNQQPSEELKTELKQLVRKEIGPIATPEIIHFTNDLPKTRSGKIMRRIIRKIAAGEYEELGDLSSLTNPQIIDDLIAGNKEERKKLKS
jgi:acetyl-CoA synthetase